MPAPSGTPPGTLTRVHTSEGVHALREAVDSSALNPLDPKDLISTFGVIGVWFVLFAETGLLIGFFLPGDSLLFLAGVAASGVGERLVGEALSLPALLIGAPICAVAGAQLGHFLGVKLGRPMFDRPESRLFKRTYVEKAEYYFNKFGPAKAVVLARFIPIVRTFLNPLAGVLEMPARQFLLWNVIGAVLWTDGIILAGYYLGDSIPAETVDRYLLPVIALVIAVSLLPIFVEVARELIAKRRLRTAATSLGANSPLETTGGEKIDAPSS